MLVYLEKNLKRIRGKSIQYRETLVRFGDFMSASLLLNNFSHISVSPSFHKPSLENPSLKKRFSVIYPKHDIHFTKMPRSCEKIISLKIYLTIFCTLGLIFLNKDFRTSFYLYSRSISVILTPKSKADAPSPNPMPDHLKGSAKAPREDNLDALSAILNEENKDELFIASPTGSVSHAHEILRAKDLLKLRRTPTAASDSEDDEAFHHDGSDDPFGAFNHRANLRIDVSFAEESSTTPESLTPIARHPISVRFPASLLQERLQEIVAGQFVPKSVATPDGFPALRTSLLPPRAAIGNQSLPDVKALSHFETARPVVTRGTFAGAKRNSWPSVREKSSNAISELLPTAASPEKLRLIETTLGLQKSLEDLDAIDLLNLKAFWTSGSILPFLKSDLKLDKQSITPPDLEELLELKVDQLDKNKFLIIGQYMLLNDKDLDLCYGKILIEASSKLLIAARSCFDVGDDVVKEIEDFEEALNHFLSIEDDEELEESFEDLLCKIGQSAYLWICKIKTDKDYMAAQIFKEILDIAHILHETGRESPSLHAPAITRMMAFINKWNA